MVDDKKVEDMLDEIEILMSLFRSAFERGDRGDMRIDMANIERMARDICWELDIVD
jgi:hypothetical protein